MKIHRENVEKDFLGIKNENWMAASRDLGAHALRLYLYLAANRDGYDLALSQVAATNAIGIKRTTYHDQFRVLLNKGYIVPVQGNIYAFYEKPQPRTVIDEKDNIPERGFDFEKMSSDTRTSPYAVKESPQENIEINNKYVSIDTCGINNGGEINKKPIAEKKLPNSAYAEEIHTISSEVLEDASRRFDGFIF